MMPALSKQEILSDPRIREAGVTIPVYGQLPFVPERASGCDIFTKDGRRILDLYGGHAVAALGYGHPRLVKAITEQSRKLLFQSNAVALDIRAEAAEKLVAVGRLLSDLKKTPEGRQLIPDGLGAFWSSLSAVLREEQA